MYYSLWVSSQIKGISQNTLIVLYYAKNLHTIINTITYYYYAKNLHTHTIKMYEFYRDYSRRYIKLINTASELSHI